MTKHIMTAASLWLVIAGTCSLYGQQQNENTLNTLWLNVEKNYAGINSKTATVDATRLNERAVKSNMLPKIKAQAQNTYGTYEGSPGAFFPQAGFFNVSGSATELDGSATAANSFGSATFEWELFAFGKRRKENEATGALSNKAISEKEAYLLSLKKILSERYMGLLYSTSKENWTLKNAKRLDEIRKITAGLSASGLKPAADSLLASSSYVQAMGELDKWSGSKNASLIKLMELYVADSLNYNASVERFNNPMVYNLSRNQLISPTHPILEVLHNQSEYYTLSAEEQKRASLPSINLLGGYAYRGTGIRSDGITSAAWNDGFTNSTNNYLAGIGITWNITSLYTNKLKGEALHKQAESVKSTQLQYQQAMQADLIASIARIQHQYQQLQKTKLAVKQSGDAYQMYLARYKSGLIVLTELLQIRLLFEQAENAHIEASKDYWVLLAYEAELNADFDFLFNNL